MAMSAVSEGARISQVRSAVMSYLGVSTLCVGSAILWFVDAEHAWERRYGLVYLLISAACFVTWATTRARLDLVSERLLLTTASLGTAGVMITGSESTAFLPSLGSLSVLVLVPGVVIRARDHNERTIFVLACAVYVLSLILRLLIRVDDPTSSAGEWAVKVIVPISTFSLVWLMVRAKSASELAKSG